MSREARLPTVARASSFAPDAVTDAVTFLCRLPVTLLLLSAGLAVGCKAKTPEITAPFVGAVEIICGALILIGLFTRLHCR